VSRCSRRMVVAVFSALVTTGSGGDGPSEFVASTLGMPVVVPKQVSKQAAVPSPIRRPSNGVRTAADVQPRQDSSISPQVTGKDFAVPPPAEDPTHVGRGHAASGTQRIEDLSGSGEIGTEKCSGIAYTRVRAWSPRKG
jgi:hypothetical protein